MENAVLVNHGFIFIEKQRNKKQNTEKLMQVAFSEKEKN